MVNSWIDGYYYAANVPELEKIDDEKYKNIDREYDFYTLLAQYSKPTGLKSKKGHEIFFSYTDWRDMFFRSTDYDDHQLFNALATCTGAAAFEIENDYGEICYILAMNSQVYSTIKKGVKIITKSHELGHLLLDHPIKNHKHRYLHRELCADYMGFKSLTSEEISFLEEDYISKECFIFKHVLELSSIEIGESGLDLICDKNKITEADARDQYYDFRHRKCTWTNITNAISNFIEDFLRNFQYKLFLKKYQK